MGTNNYKVFLFKKLKKFNFISVKLRGVNLFLKSQRSLTLFQLNLFLKSQRSLTLFQLNLGVNLFIFKKLKELFKEV